MTQTRAEIVEAMAREMFMLDRAVAGSDAEAEYIKWESFRLTDGGAFWIARAEAALDIALKAAAKILRQRIENYIEDHGIFDMETGATEFPGNGEDFVSDWEEIEEEILALTSEGPKY